MCSGRDVLTAVALGTAAYFAGPLIFGAEAGAGAVAGSEAAANAVGAAGGDAIGSLIASNATNWGLTVAPEIAATGIAAGGAAASGLSTAKNLAPFASIISTAMGGKPAAPPAIGSPAAPPQESRRPEPNVFKKKGLPIGDPTMLTGPSGVETSSLTLGRSTLLGS